MPHSKLVDSRERDRDGLRKRANGRSKASGSTGPIQPYERPRKPIATTGEAGPHRISREPPCTGATFSSVSAVAVDSVRIPRVVRVSRADEDDSVFRRASAAKRSLHRPCLVRCRAQVTACVGEAARWPLSVLGRGHATRRTLHADSSSRYPRRWRDHPQRVLRPQLQKRIPMKLHYYPETDSLYIELSEEPGVEAMGSVRWRERGYRCARKTGRLRHRSRLEPA